jgi:MEMO1 family protein
MNDNRPSAYAGKFYPLEPQLSEILKSFFSLSKKVIKDQKVRGVILPHAGYPFSGQTAADGITQIDPQQYSQPTVILIGPCHQIPSPNASVWNKGGWETPLGSVPVDQDKANLILSSTQELDDNFEPHSYEHSLEVQLPFLQYLFNHQFKIVPIAIGNQKSSFCRKLGVKLREFIDENTILLASSDLYHGYSLPACKKNDAEIINEIGKYQLDNISSMLDQRMYSEDSYGCGIGPILTILTALEKMKSGIQLVSQTNSAEATGVEGGYVVGYSSFAIY